MSAQNQLVATDNKNELKQEVQAFILGGELSRKLTSTQKDLCVRTSLAYNLNPIKREVHFVPYNNDIKIVVGYEVYLKRAENSGKLNGWKVDIQGAGANMKAVVTIHRKDWDKPFEHEVYFAEVRNSTPLWLKMPRFMLKKVAIAQAFRLAFPEELGGMPYMPEEIGVEVKDKKELSAPAADEHVPVNEENNDSTKDTQAEQLNLAADEETEAETPTCSLCSRAVSEKVASYSTRYFGQILCMDCQKKQRASATSA